MNPDAKGAGPLRGGLDRSNAASDDRRSLSVAVVVPTYRRPDLLRRCLEALVAQRLAGNRYEIVVVDDGQTEDTRALVARFSAATRGAPSVRYLRPVGTRGPASARNRGWRSTTAPLVAFTDDDTVPDANWLVEGLAAMQRDAWVAAAGGVVVPLDGPPTDHALMTKGLETAEFVTANAFVRRRALETVGGFDERFLRAWREDSDLQFSLMSRCGEVGRAPAAIVLHPVRPAPWGISLGQQKNVCFDALLYRKHRTMFRERIRRHPPWSYLAIVGCSIASAIAAALGEPAGAVASAGLALLLVLAFAAKRLARTSHAPAHVAEMLLTSFAIPFLALYWRAVGAWRFRVLVP